MTRAPMTAFGAGDCFERLDVAEAVLQRDDHAIVAKQRRDRRTHRRGVIRLDADENRVEATGQCRRRCRDLQPADAVIAPDAVDAQPVRGDRIEMRLPAEQRDLASGAREKATEHRAERAGAGNENTLQHAPPSNSKRGQNHRWPQMNTDSDSEVRQTRPFHRRVKQPNKLGHRFD